VADSEGDDDADCGIEGDLAEMRDEWSLVIFSEK
jgi:hypothetical protein